ncbi:hypothetical protein [Anaeroselena agilis]|uniref:Uncharacterized protein n=1 Tax=Anaeroselena agilis TaxID=3063788 RepID=A0ABU3P4Y3_9FIRM|nr:hypothetical protein [Selenomonadales bacterium 4137-cl]
MECEELAAERCPCTLAETAECTYCTHLRGETVCDCDWQGRCAFERYQWRDGDDRPPGTVVAVRPLAGATGLIVKGGGILAAATAGTTVKFRLPVPGGRNIGAVVLRSYPSGQVYLLSFDPCPADLLLGQAIKPAPVGNAFAGHETLAAAAGRQIVILASAPLAALLAPLADGLRARGSRVTLASPADWTADNDAILFAAGRENEIKRMATGLPPSFRGRIVTWVTGE